MRDTTVVSVIYEFPDEHGAAVLKEIRASLLLFNIPLHIFLCAYIYIYLFIYINMYVFGDVCIPLSLYIYICTYIQRLCIHLLMMVFTSMGEPRKVHPPQSFHNRDGPGQSASQGRS